MLCQNDWTEVWVNGHVMLGMKSAMPSICGSYHKEPGSTNLEMLQLNSRIKVITEINSSIAFPLQHWNRFVWMKWTNWNINKNDKNLINLFSNKNEMEQLK